jgi:hypothetical protein
MLSLKRWQGKFSNPESHKPEIAQAGFQWRYVISVIQ